MIHILVDPSHRPEVWKLEKVLHSQRFIHRQPAQNHTAAKVRGAPSNWETQRKILRRMKIAKAVAIGKYIWQTKIKLWKASLWKASKDIPGTRSLQNKGKTCNSCRTIQRRKPTSALLKDSTKGWGQEQSWKRRKMMRESHEENYQHRAKTHSIFCWHSKVAECLLFKNLSMVTTTKTFQASCAAWLLHCFGDSDKSALGKIAQLSCLLLL